MKHRGYCRNCDSDYTLLDSEGNARYRPTYCPGCGKIPVIVWTVCEDEPDSHILTEAAGAGEPDLTEVMVVFAAKIYDVLSPSERLTLWQIVRLALNK